MSTRGSAASTRRILDAAERAFANLGRATELDLARAEAQLNATLALLPPLETAVHRSIHRLAVLAGQLPPALIPRLSPSGRIPDSPAVVQLDTPESLLRRRPDIRAAERALAGATARIGIQTADLFPRVTFNGRAAFEAAEISGLLDAGADAYSFGPRISWAALDLGRVRARIKAARANADAELAVYEKTVLLALEETENALVDFGRSRVRRDALLASARAADQALALARQRYEGGVADFLTVLDAQRTQLSIQDQLARGESSIALAAVALYQSLRGGWETENAAAPK